MATKPLFKIGDCVSWRTKTDLGSLVYNGRVVQIIEPGDPVPEGVVGGGFDSSAIHRYVVELSRTSDLMVPNPARLVLQARNAAVVAQTPKDGDSLTITLSKDKGPQVCLNGQPLKRVRNLSFSVSADQEPILSLDLIGFDMTLQGYLANVVELMPENEED